MQEIKEIGPYSMFDISNQTAYSTNFFHMNFSYEQGG
jgi:hypothetical protein